MPDVGPGRGAPASLDAVLRERFIAAMPGLKERAKTLIELIDGAYYLYGERPLALDDKAKALLTQAARENLGKIAPLLAAPEGEWTAARLESVVRGFAESHALKLGQVAQPLRAALTGRATSPGLFDVMGVLGREECLARINDAAATSDGLAA